MPLQARFQEHDPRLYNVNRDLAHNFKEVLELTAARLEDGTWPELDELLKQNDVTLDDLGEACVAFCTYVASAATDKQASMLESLTNAGWFECKTGAQAGYMAVLGTVLAGVAHRGIREATLDEEGPALKVGDLVGAGDKCLQAIRTSTWRRYWLSIKSRIGGALKSLRGK